jgi:hypothetical protein
MIEDRELRRKLKDMYYLCDGFLCNNCNVDAVIYIVKKLDDIDSYGQRHYALNENFLGFKRGVPVIKDSELDLISRSRKEKFISILKWALIMPFIILSLLAARQSSSAYQAGIDYDYLYNDKKREVARNIVNKKVVKILEVTLRFMDKVK